MYFFFLCEGLSNGDAGVFKGRRTSRRYDRELVSHTADFVGEKLGGLYRRTTLWPKKGKPIRGITLPPKTCLVPAPPAENPLVYRFVQARRLAKDDPDGMAAMCQQLLANGELETAMRAGDVYAALVDHFFGRGDWQQCYSLMAR